MLIKTIESSFKMVSKPDI